MESKIIYGDCIEEMKKLENNSIDMIITDPPYTTPIISGFGRKRMKNVADLSIQEQYIILLKKEFERILKPNGRVFIFCDDKYYPSIFRAFYDWNSSQMVVWDKGKIGMGKPFRKQHELIFYANREPFEYIRNGYTFATVMKFKQVFTKDRLHPAEKPIELIRELIKGFSNEGDTILDPFVGSGTVVLACKELKRIGIGIELNEDFVEIANKRCILPKQGERRSGK